MLDDPEPIKTPQAPLQLLLFIDERSSSRQQVEQVQQHLASVRGDNAFQLQIIDVSSQPYLAEHFKLVATPTLMKVCPDPPQTLTGTDLVRQLEACWSQWQQIDLPPPSDEYQSNGHNSDGVILSSDCAQILRLSDEIFRLTKDEEALKKQLRFKDRIIAMLAHDLRNPLAATSIALETLELAIEPKGKGEAYGRVTPELIGQLIQHARTQTRAIDQMITDILQAARGSHSELRIEPQAVELGPLCREVLENFTRRLATKSQRLQTDIPQDLPPVYADSKRICQVITNLLDNAIKYTPEGGKIKVSVLHRTTQKVQISVCDSGHGIPESDRQHIFEDTFRLKRDVTQEGYGIGLALCQRLIRAHYGRIWVDSVPGEGSCFHCTLPIYHP